jgi:hypothetical protein
MKREVEENDFKSNFQILQKSPLCSGLQEDYYWVWIFLGQIINSFFLEQE